MRIPIFPNLQSIGNGAKTTKEAKSNAIIAFLAHMEKRKQVGLFVPYLVKIIIKSRHCFLMFSLASKSSS
jgi:hypothetical protein